VALLDKEVKELTDKHILSSDIASTKRICLQPFEQKGSFICGFFNYSANKCKIYSRRPFECQLYPFLINRRGKKIYLAIDLHCPFARENLKSKKGEDYIIYLAKLFRTPEYSSILKDNPQIIQEYQEVIDLKELSA